VEHWGAVHFDSVVTVDLERKRDFHRLFSQSDPTRALDELGVLRGRSVTPGKTLLFLDEIQACPPALALLRYFYQPMPELHVIAAGSPLDFALREFEYSCRWGGSNSSIYNQCPSRNSWPRPRASYLWVNTVTFCSRFCDAVPARVPILFEVIGHQICPCHG
jgi:hypothetical protein